MKRLLILTVCFALCAVLAAAADVTGTWKGQFDFSGTAVPLTFEFKAAGNALTGTITGLPSGVAKIENGKVDGDKISFSAMTEYQGSPIKIVYTGQVVNGDLRLSMGTEDGSWGVDFVAKRSS